MTWQTLNQQLTFMRRSKRPTPSCRTRLARPASARTFGVNMRRRLFTGCADLAVERGFQKPQNRGCPKPIGGDGALVRMYAFARSKLEATEIFANALAVAHYKVLQISEVEPNGSNKLWPMDDKFATPQDISRARSTGQVVFGWFIGYANTEPSGCRQRRFRASVDNETR